MNDIFGTKYINQNTRIAKILVEDLYKNNLDIFAISNQISDEKSGSFLLNTINEMKEYVKECFDSLNEMTDGWPNGLHVGDCTQISASCYRCYEEGMYEKAIKAITDLKTLMPELNHNELILKLLEIRFATQYYFKLFIDIYKVDKVKGREYFNISQSVEKRYKIWNKMSSTEKLEYKNQAILFLTSFICEN